MKDLDRVAQDDGIVTEEEKILLTTVEDSIVRYKDLIDEVLYENEVTDQEYNMMKLFETQIIDLTRNEAEKDGIFSEDEKHIYYKLRELIMQLDDLPDL